MNISMPQFSPLVATCNDQQRTLSDKNIPLLFPCKCDVGKENLIDYAKIFINLQSKPTQII